MGRCLCRQVLITLVMPLHRAGSANATTSVCLCRKKERPLRCRPIVRPCPVAGLGSPVPRGRSAIASLRRNPSLCFDTCATVPETQLLPAVLLTNLPVTSTDCPAVQRGAWRFPGPPFRGRSAIALIQSCSPCSHLPWLFSDVSGMPLPSMSIDQLGPSIGQEHRRGPASNCPPHFAPLPVIQLRLRR